MLVHRVSHEPKKMKSRRGFDLVMTVVILFLTVAIGVSSESSEFKPLVRFLRAVYPRNMLKLGHDGSRQNPCLDKWRGLKCNLQANTIVGIMLEKSNLSGVIDADSLCKLPNLRVLSLAENHIRGTIPSSMLGCRKLRYLNLSSNLLSGRIPSAVIKMKHLMKLDISKNHFEGIIPNSKEEFKHLNVLSMKASALESSTVDREESTDKNNAAPGSSKGSQSKNIWSQQWIIWILLILGIVFCLLIVYFVVKKASKLSKEKAILKALRNSSSKTPLTKAPKEVKPEKRLSELVFFVEEQERFKLEDLLEATADLRSQSLCSTLYKVALKNNAIYAVKRLKKLQMPFEEFDQIMRQISYVKHENILPLVAYSRNPEEKLLIYKYQNKGSLLNLLEGKFFSYHNCIILVFVQNITSAQFT